MFTDVSLKEHHLPTPVHLIIGKTHLRITHVGSRLTKRFDMPSSRL